jgi:hypothetical protein
MNEPTQAGQLAEASARRRAAAEAAAQPEGGSPTRTAPRTRIPFGTMAQKLAAPRREGFHRHWFNDEPGGNRIQDALSAGYAHVNGDGGKPISRVVGVARGGGPLTAYLMETPQEWYAADMAAQEAEYGSRVAAIKEGHPPGGPSGNDAAAQYVGKQGISIREGRR